MNIEELCERANERLNNDDVVHQSGRVSVQVTPRNVRYYQTIGLLPHPTRVDGRADYNEHHIDNIIDIKRAQANGESLREISRQDPVSLQHFPDPADNEFLLAKFRQDHFSPNVLTSFSYLHNAAISPSASITEFGWSFQIGNVTISGFGDRPSTQQIEQLTNILNADHNEDDY